MCVTTTYDIPPAYTVPARAEARSQLLPPMHYPQLVSTTCVLAGMIAMGAVVGNWPDDSAPPQPCRHVLDGLPYPLVMHVSRSVECGS
ncbi:MAG TPA: hypothetical protein DEF43_00195, partial [Chloroflexus aurantiacus]|nr:hypothetical protein [Chloroflexus aurantiacus]